MWIQISESSKYPAFSWPAWDWNMGIRILEVGTRMLVPSDKMNLVHIGDCEFDDPKIQGYKDFINCKLLLQFNHQLCWVPWQPRHGQIFLYYNLKAKDMRNSPDHDVHCACGEGLKDFEDNFPKIAFMSILSL